MRTLTISFLFIVILSTPVSQQSEALGQQSGRLSGVVVDSAGNPLWGITVRAESLVSDYFTIVVTDKRGRFDMPDLQPGTYEVKVLAADGVAILDKMHVGIELDQKTDVKFQLQQGPIPPVPFSKVPPRKKNPRDKSPANQPEGLVKVLDEAFDNQVMLQDWLRTLEDKGKQYILGIVPLTSTKSLIVLEPRGNRPKVRYSVLSVSSSLTRRQLEENINSFPNKTFVGIVNPDADSFLIVLRDAK